MSFDKCAQPCSHHNHPDTEPLHHPQEFASAPSHPVHSRPPPWILAATNLLSLIVGLPFLEFHVTELCSILFLASFTLHTLLRFTCCCVSSLSFIIIIITKQYSIVQTCLSLFICSPVEGHLGCFQSAATRDEVAGTFLSKSSFGNMFSCLFMS